MTCLKFLDENHEIFLNPTKIRVELLMEKDKKELVGNKERNAGVSGIKSIEITEMIQRK